MIRGGKIKLSAKKLPCVAALLCFAVLALPSPCWSQETDDLYKVTNLIPQEIVVIGEVKQVIKTPVVMEGEQVRVGDIAYVVELVGASSSELKKGDKVVIHGSTGATGAKSDYCIPVGWGAGNMVVCTAFLQAARGQFLFDKEKYAQDVDLVFRLVKKVEPTNGVVLLFHRRTLLPVGVDSPSVVNDKEAPAMAEAIRLLPKLFDAETIRAPEFATSLLKSDNDYVWSLGVAIKVAAWDFVSWQRVRQMFPDLPADQLAVKADELNREQRKRTLEELSKMAQTDHRKKWLKHLSEKFLPNDKAK